MGGLLLIGGGLMCLAPGLAEAGNSTALVWVFTAHMLCYMPTLGLSNTIVFSNIKDQNEFPRIRVWGTIGWIAAGLAVGFQGWSASLNIFWLAAICSLVLGTYCFTLPHTPPPAKGKPLDLRTVFMVDAFRMLASVPFFVFIVCSMLICIPLAYYFGYTSQFLSQTGFEQPASVMTLGQMSELVFMLLIPFFFRRLGVKWMILVGMAAWAVRYLLFALGAPDQVVWMLLLAVLLHGVSYDFFFVTGFMYADKKAPAEVRGQAQGMLVFFTQGVGMYIGYWIAGWRFSKMEAEYTALNTAIAAQSTPETLSFGQTLIRMFSFGLPEGLNADLLATTMRQWQHFWYLPAGMAAVVFVIFLVAFHEKKEINSAEPRPEEATAPDHVPNHV